jgi:hypothetical protein
MIMIKAFFVLLTIASLPLFFSCSSDPDNPEDIGNDTIAQVLDVKIKANAQNIFNSVPGTNEIARMVSDASLEYDAGLLNDPNKYNSYGTDDYKSLNLGVYGTDLSYTSTFEQTQESMLYLKCVNQLCGGLGISGVFDEKTTDRIDANKENRDSLLDIISKSFEQADRFLKENQRSHSSALLVAGGWIEGTYISVKLASLSKSRAITSELIKQKASLKELIALIEGYPSGEETKYVHDDLRALQTPFDELASKFAALDKKAELDVSILIDIDAKVSALRKKITQN